MGGGGNFTGTIDVDKIIASANERIRNAFAEGDYVLFAAAFDDQEEIRERIGSSTRLKNLSYQIAHDQNDIDIDQINGAAVIVIYAGSNKSEAWLVEFVRRSLSARKSIIATTAKDAPAIIPQYVSQYRMRLVSWEELAGLLS